jgi:hypothetical protein
LWPFPAFWRRRKTILLPAATTGHFTIATATIFPLAGERRRRSSPCPSDFS